MNSTNTEVDIEKLIADKVSFYNLIYTPLDEAIIEFEKRKGDKELLQYVEKSLPAGIPKELSAMRNIILSRSLVTPNYELRRFMSAVDGMDDFTPVFWEYWQDDFRPNVSPSKHHLAKMTFYLGHSKNGEEKIARQSIVDFNTENGKKLADVKTVWGQGFVDFHHELFNVEYKDKVERAVFFDASEWYKKSGESVREYYKHVFTLFLVHGILFENFLIENETEAQFVREVFLPAFMEIVRETGRKPLIVALDPTEMEGHDFWMYYPHHSKNHIKSKLNLL
ncbi:MAG: hypothetical protein WC761_04180 [Candidatus Paceibacterota bacterium]|jgi:hypothetical protein